MSFSIDVTSRMFCNNIIEKQETNFIAVVNDCLKEYITLLEKTGCDSEIIEDVRDFYRNILLCLNLYYAGSRWDAYQAFVEAIETIPIQSMVRKMPLGNYYRARKPEKKGELLTPKGMFHIPFDVRYRVSIQRYSYPGYPCLYLGSTPEVCCEEVDCFDPDLNIAQFHFCNDNLLLLDMCFFEGYDFQNLTQEQFQLFGRVWPLVLICSLRYRDVSEMRFRPDYIIPQMLLEHIIDKSLREQIFDAGTQSIQGIRYCSVRNLMQRFEHGDFEKYMNYVLPVQQIKGTGYCSFLENHFKLVKIAELKDF